MKREFGCWLACLLMAASAFAAGVPSAPGVPLLDGNTISLADYRGTKPVLLKFWATWCVECLAQMPEYRNLFGKYGDTVQFVAVNVAVSDPIEDVRAAVRHHNLDMLVAYDQAGQLWNEFDLRGTPTYVLIDGNGNVVHTGYGHDKALADALEAVTNNRSISTPNTSIIEAAESKVTSLDLTDIDGHSLHVSAEPVALLYHFATWCESYLLATDLKRVEHCRRFRTALRTVTNVPVIGVATRYSTDPDGVRRYRDEYDIRHPLVLDETGTFGALSGVRDFPFAVVLRWGKVVQASAEIDEAILNALHQLSTASGIPVSRYSDQPNN